MSFHNRSTEPTGQPTQQLVPQQSVISPAPREAFCRPHQAPAEQTPTTPVESARMPDPAATVASTSAAATELLSPHNTANLTISASEVEQRLCQAARILAQGAVRAELKRQNQDASPASTTTGVKAKLPVIKSQNGMSGKQTSASIPVQNRDREQRNGAVSGQQPAPQPRVQPAF